MIDFELAIIIGAKLEEIRLRIENFESMHLGLFINSLFYKSEKEGKKKKGDFVTSTTQSIKLINKEINKLNTFIKYFNKLGLLLTMVEKMDHITIKKFILNHKGDYPRAEGVAGIKQEFLGEGDSPSVLARRHTSLEIRNVIFRTKLSLSEFVKSIGKLLEVFNSVEVKELRPNIQNEIEKAKSTYSIGLFGESIFILGRLLENLTTEYILLLKKDGKISLARSYILSPNFDFHKKIEFLNSKNLHIFSNSQFSKLMSVKWDRNIYGHKINLKTKDHRAMVEIGLIGIVFFDKKIAKLKEKLQK